MSERAEETMGSAGAEVTPEKELRLSGRIDSLREVALTLLREVESLEETRVPNESQSINLQDELRRYEIDLICRALQRTRGHQVRAARLLGMKVTTLNSKIKRYGISLEPYANDYSANLPERLDLLDDMNHAA